MAYEDDFVKDEVIEFEIEGRPFAYKPVTAGDEADWVDEYMEIDENGKSKQNINKLTQCKLRNLVKVPYEKDTINKLIGVNKEWEHLNKDDRWKVLRKLKPTMFSTIIKKINSFDSVESEQKKN